MINIRTTIGAIFLLGSFAVQAQVTGDKLKKRIVITRNDMRVDSFLNQVAKQTGIGFSFNSKKISPGKSIGLNKGSYTLEECLLKFQQASGIHYASLKNHIVLVDNPPQEKFRLQLSAPPPKPKKETLRVIVTPPPVARYSELDNKAVVPHPNIAQNISYNKSVYTDSAEPPANAIATQRAAIIKMVTGKEEQPPAPTTAAAPAAKPARIRADRDGNSGWLIGLSAVRPDIYDLFGVGLTVQRERFIGSKWSWTLSAGYLQVLGQYDTYYYKDTIPWQLKDSSTKNWGQVPLMIGLRYFPLKALYASVEAGYTIKASNDVVSYVSFAPSIGAKLPMGGSELDLNLSYLYMMGMPTIPEKSQLHKGDFGYWGLRVAYKF